MRVMVFVKATADSEKGFQASEWTEAMMAAMGRFNDELSAAGVLLDVGGLQPTAAAKRIAINGDSRSVIAGPFSPPGQQVAGFWLWQVKDLDEALYWAKRCPAPMPGPCEIEIRPLFQPEDLQ